MNVSEVLDDYVGDVLRQLPPAMRDDVGFELRAALDDALAERAAAEGRTADYPMALAVLRDFGTPSALAARYLPEAAPLLAPEETRPFVLLGATGVALQWLLTLPAAVTQGDLGTWWLTRGLGAFWWPGLLAMGAALRHAIRQRHARSADSPLPAVQLDREHVERLPSVLGVWAGIAGAVVLLCLPLLREVLPAAGARAFAFAPEFAPWRAWPVLPLWTLTLGVRAQAIRLGRWTSALRRWRLVGNLGFAALLTYWALGGPVLAGAGADAVAKSCFLVIVTMIALDLLGRWTRRRARIAPPSLHA
jgi:hypothetical protein